VSTFITERRKNKIISVLKARQKSLHIILENIHDSHNVSAIFRTCDAVGVPKVSLVYTVDTFPKIGKKSSASAFKWIGTDKYRTINDCYRTLRKQGFKIYASAIMENAKNLYNLDFSQKSAIILGNEHCGISDEALEFADERFYIPMKGMVQSLNVSVAAAIILYEALRQRTLKELYEKSEYSSKELEEKINDWSRK